MESPQRQMSFKANEQANALRPNPERSFSAPLFGNYVPAGFPSPTMNYKEESLDLNDLCVQHPTATYYVRASGESMLDAGIHDKDILVVDRSIRANDGDIVVAALNGDFTVKVLRTLPNLTLDPRNDAYDPIIISDNDDFDIFGVVTFVVHSTY